MKKTNILKKKKSPNLGMSSTGIIMLNGVRLSDLIKEEFPTGQWTCDNTSNTSITIAIVPSYPPSF